MDNFVVVAAVHTEHTQMFVLVDTREKKNAWSGCQIAKTVESVKKRVHNLVINPVSQILALPKSNKKI